MSGWAHPNAYARVHQPAWLGDDWLLEGWTLVANDGSAGGGAGVVCFDAIFQARTEFYLNNAGPGTEFEHIGPSVGQACGVENIGGNFAAGEVSMFDGAELFRFGIFGSPSWFAEADAGHHIGGSCYDTVIPIW